MSDYKKNLPNDGEVMAGHIAPGPCDPVYGCPPPTIIECISVDKIYDECKEILTREPSFNFTLGEVTDVECREIIFDPENDVETEIINGRVRIKVEYSVKVRVWYLDGSNNEVPTTIYIEDCFESTVLFPRAGEQGLKVMNEVYIECLEALISEENECVTITACVGIMVLFKLYARVQLLVPSYGFCPQPPECEEVEDVCPDFQPIWPPYPEQDR